MNLINDFKPDFSLFNDIKQYCEINDITDINKFINGLIKKSFDQEKYPPIQFKDPKGKKKVVEEPPVVQETVEIDEGPWELTVEPRPQPQPEPEPEIIDTNVVEEPPIIIATPPPPVAPSNPGVYKPPYRPMPSPSQQGNNDDSRRRNLYND